MTMDAMACLLSRQSTPPALLTEPAPDAAVLDEVLGTATRAPDHAALRPWRFLLIRGAARERLGEEFAAAQRRRNPGIGAADLDKARAKPLRAPLIIVVAAEVTEDHPKAPVVEQVVAAAAAGQNVLNALHAKGFGAILLTGTPAHDAGVKAALGLKAQDEIIGFIYTGSISETAPVKSRPDVAAFVREWDGPAMAAAGAESSGG